jgi:hypothetical protein
MDLKFSTKQSQWLVSGGRDCCVTKFSTHNSLQVAG